LFEQKNGLQILRIQKVGIAISYADRWFPTTSPHHSAKNKIDISRGMGAFNIINMNGRVYDPATGMFLSPDPVIQSPGDWVNYNRYSYCMGNPLKYTDPSGYVSGDQAKWTNEDWLNYWVELSEKLKAEGAAREQGRLIEQQRQQQQQQDFYGRNKYDNMGMYIPAYARPGGANPANYGNPSSGHWETTITENFWGTCYKKPDGTYSDIVQHYEKTVDSRFVFDQGAGESVGDGGDGNGRGVIVSMINGTAAFGLGPTGDMGMVIDSHKKTLLYITVGYARGFGASSGIGVTITNKGFESEEIGGEAVNASITLPFLKGLISGNGFLGNDTHGIGLGVGIGSGYFITNTYTFTVPIPNEEYIYFSTFGY